MPSLLVTEKKSFEFVITYKLKKLKIIIISSALISLLSLSAE